ncbi:hypothetical protein [Roseibium algae]|uniref:Uncharacterized protein n=1 Tax=Roseibium algae TaxID=3123038 RepID=A0ABU8TIN9_9HYPH
MRLIVGPVFCFVLLLSLIASPVLADSLPEPDNLPIPLPGIPRSADCDAYARSYADSYLGNGDPTGDIVAGGMRGAVIGGGWSGAGGAERGARAGGAVAVLDNLAAYPGGWQGLYDMAFQICSNETSGANYRPQTDPYQTQGQQGANCRSSAGVATRSSRGPISAGSGRNNCR